VAEEENKPGLSLGDVAAVASVAAGALYFTGFLTVLIHTSQMGLPLVEAAQLRYIWTGTVPVLFVGLVVGLSYALSKWAYRVRARALRRRDAPAQRWDWKTVGPFTANVLSLILGLISCLAAFLELPMFRTHPDRILATALSLVALLVFTALLLLFGAWLFRSEFLDRHPRLHTALFVAPAVAAGLIAVVWYSLHLYPFVPAYLGGGMPVPVRLVLDRNSFDEAAVTAFGWSSGAPHFGAAAPAAGPTDAGLISPRVWLVYSSADLYLIGYDRPEAWPARGPSCIYLAVRKDAVVAVLAAPG